MAQEMGNHRSTKWYYIGGDDEQTHGPFSSDEMFQWWNNKYFDSTLLLRTENDMAFFPLSEWIQACGNRIPFLLPVKSMEWLQSENMNQLNAQMDCYSLSGTPSSTPTPTLTMTMRPVDPQQQQPPLGPIQLLANNPRPHPGQQPPRQMLLMNAPPPPLTGMNAPLIIPVSSVPGGFQLIQQQQRVQTAPPPPPMSQYPQPQHPPFVPMRFPPPPPYYGQGQQQMNNGGGAEQQRLQQEGANMINSDSPDSGHVLTPCSYPFHQLQTGPSGGNDNQQQLAHHRLMQHENKYADTSDAPWKRTDGGAGGGEAPPKPPPVQLIDAGTNTDSSQFNHSKETQTDDINIQISQADAERLLSQWTGIRVRITLTD